MYYYLHLAIPMAWLAGYALSEVGAALWAGFSRTGWRVSSAKTWKSLAICAVASFVLVRSERRLEAGVADLRGRPRVGADPILAEMKRYASRTRWAYVQFSREIYPFHAQLLMPPEVAMVTLKRFWSDQCSEEQIVELCGRYKVEQVLLPAGGLTDKWSHFLQGFAAAFRDANYSLYIAPAHNSP